MRNRGSVLVIILLGILAVSCGDYGIIARGGDNIIRLDDVAEPALVSTLSRPTGLAAIAQPVSVCHQ